MARKDLTTLLDLAEFSDLSRGAYYRDKEREELLQGKRRQAHQGPWRAGREIH